MGERLRNWYVKIGSNFEGPFSAESIREALRVGELDPFALVTPDSKNVPAKPLIDVNEIFEVGKPTESKASDIKAGLEDLNQTVQLPDEDSNPSEEKAHSEQQDDDFFFIPQRSEDEDDLNKTVRSEDVRPHSQQGGKAAKTSSSSSASHTEKPEKASSQFESIMTNITNALSTYADMIPASLTNVKEKLSNPIESITSLLNPQKPKHTPSALDDMGESLRQADDQLYHKIEEDFKTNNKLKIKSTLFQGVKGKSGRKASSKSKAKKTLKKSHKAKNTVKKKKYIIVVGNKEYGPFSSTEIVNSHKKGKLAGGLIVKKLGSSARLRVNKFCELYGQNQARKAASGPAYLGNKYNVSPDLYRHSSSFTNGLSSQITQLVVGLLVIAVVAGGGLYIYKGHLFGKNSSYTKRVAAKKKPRTTTVRRSSKSSSSKRKSSVRSSSTRRITKSKSSSKKMSIPKSISSSKTARKPTYKYKRARRTPTYMKKNTSSPKVLSAKLVENKSRTNRSSPATASVIRRANLAARVDKTVSIGPLYYSLRDLAKCPTKCTLTMRDSAGQTVQVTFFKNAKFEGKLKAKKGRASISGIVKSSGKKLILQEVR